MELLNFFRSGTSHRLRIALNLKGLQYEYRAVNLRRGEHLMPEYRRLNPQGLVPALVVEGRVMTQSPAIIEWIEETWPQPSLLPSDAHGRARVRAMAAIVGCDIHPLNNRRVPEMLRWRFGCDETAVNEWCAHWIAPGFDAIEAMLHENPSRVGFCFGKGPTLADAYLVPQVESARRFGVDLERWPAILEVVGNCGRIDPFRLAAPSNQPDAS